MDTSDVGGKQKVNFWVNKKYIHNVRGNEKLKKRCFTENFDS
jgi:hypothetical protein